MHYFYFWPAWNSDFSYVHLDLKSGGIFWFDIEGRVWPEFKPIFDFQWPVGTGDAGDMHFWIALLEPDNSALFEGAFDSVGFGYADLTPTPRIPPTYTPEPSPTAPSTPTQGSTPNPTWTPEPTFTPNIQDMYVDFMTDDPECPDPAVYCFPDTSFSQPMTSYFRVAYIWNLGDDPLPITVNISGDQNENFLIRNYTQSMQINLQAGESEELFIGFDPDPPEGEKQATVLIIAESQIVEMTIKGTAIR